MNGYISNSLTFTSALHSSQKYLKKIESFNIQNINSHYFIDDLFQMILLNLHIDKIKIRIIGSKYNNNETWNNISANNLYYSYYHKQFNKKRFLLSHLKEETDVNYSRDFYGARVKYSRLKKRI